MLKRMVLAIISFSLLQIGVITGAEVGKNVAVVYCAATKWGLHDASKLCKFLIKHNRQVLDWEANNFSELVEEIDSYKTIVFSGTANKERVIDIKKYKDKLINWVKKGGNILVTTACDGSTSDLLVGLLGDLVGKASFRECKPFGTLAAIESEHPLMKGIKELRKNWAHLEGYPSEKWEILARCKEHNKPLLIAKKFGKGYIVITSCHSKDIHQLVLNLSTEEELKGKKYYFSDFEKGAPLWEINKKIGSITDNPEEIISKKYSLFSLLGDSTKSSYEWNTFASSKLWRIILEGGKTYKISFDYKVLASGKDCFFYLFARVADSPPETFVT
ncbi:MAG: hypothetical protein LWW90_09330 [Candidatus Desulfofervidus auxilii]|nr:hypothetical protein [Candidatus Desulfofervidus auxilii]